MNLSQKKVCVFGPGLSGKSALDFLKDQPISEVLIVGSGHPSNWGLKEVFFKHPFRALSQDETQCSKEMADCDLIVLSPGIAREHSLLVEAHHKGTPIWSEVELAYHFFKAPIIAVTGTNGKTTTVTLLGELFKAFGLSTFVGGNIGLPFLEALKSDYDLALLELSSFQLESLEDFHANMTSILNVFPNHGERYDDHEDYRLAKWNIIQHQKEDEYLFVGEDVGGPKEKIGKPQRVELPLSFEDDLLREVEGLDLSKIKVVGTHNRKNIWFAWKLFSTFLKEESKSKVIKVFKEVVYNFSGVEHRVEALGNIEGNLVFNDAKSTNWQATLTALMAVSEIDLPITLIMGGQLRGHNDLPTSEQMKMIKDLTHECLTIGESGKCLFEYDPYFKEVVSIEGAKKYMQDNQTQGIILFSPGFPSFDQFENYAQRGRKFKELFSIEN